MPDRVTLAGVEGGGAWLASRARAINGFFSFCMCIIGGGGRVGCGWRMCVCLNVSLYGPYLWEVGCLDVSHPPLYLLYNGNLGNV